MAKGLKGSVLVVLLMAAAFFFGHSCVRMERLAAETNVMMGFDWENAKSMIFSFAYVLLGMGMVAFAAGLVAALLKPYWVSAIAFALAGAVLWMGLGGGLRHGVLAIIFFLLSLFYSRGIYSELANRIHFSVRPIAESQSSLVLALTIVVCTGFYFGYDALIKREGFTLPPATVDMVMEVVKRQVEAQTQLEPEERERILEDLRREMDRQLKEQVEVRLKPYEGLIPIGIAVNLFLALRTALTFLAWIPTWGLRLAFPLLKTMRFTNVATEMREVSRLVL